MVGPKNALYAEESAEVEVLNANLAKLKALTKKIQGSMSRLNASGQVVQEAIGPIYSNTQQLQTTTRNIDRVNEAIERLRQPLDAKGREEGIIRAGPQASGLPQYLGAIRRVDKALSDLTVTNLRSNQQAISDFDNLLLTGVTQLQEVFRSTLREDAGQIEPLHYLTKAIPFPTIPADKIQQLSQVAAAMSSTAAQSARYGRNDSDAAAKAYIEVRGQYMADSLKSQSMAAISTSKRRTMDAGIYREQTSGVNYYADALEGMILAEFASISQVFRGQDAGRILTQTSQPSMTVLTNTFRELNGVIKARIMQDFPLSYEIIDKVTPISYRVESKTGQLRPQFQEALRPIRESARLSLTEVLIQTRTRVEKTGTLPNDGSVIPMVQETCLRLRALAIFDRPLNALLSSVGDGGWKINPSANAASNTSLPLQLTPSAENPTLTSHYMLDLVDTLLNALEARAMQPGSLNTSTLQGSFLLNSVVLIKRAVAKDADLSRYLAISPHNERLNLWSKKAAKIYMAKWDDVALELFDQVSSKSGSAGQRTSGSALDSAQIVKSLSSKDKDKIKDKFKNFTSQFDELVARHKALHMEPETRGLLAKDIQSKLGALYVKFWDRYHEIGKGKVAKYSKTEMAQMLASLA